jgi:hypothetical protein
LNSLSETIVNPPQVNPHRGARSKKKNTAGCSPQYQAISALE